MMHVDCVIPAHEKDFDTLGHTIASVRRCCPEVGRIVVISQARWTDKAGAGAEWFDEAAEVWPFRKADLEDCGCQPGWLLQQLLKLHAPLLIPGLAANVLVCDADVVWLDAGGVRFFEAPQRAGAPPSACFCTFTSESCPPIRSSVDLHRYDRFVPAMLPGLEKPRPGAESAVSHHAPLQRDIIEALFARVEAAHPGKQGFWAAFRDAARLCGGRASEYELYHAFARRFFPGQVVARPLPFAVVGDLGAALRAPPPRAAYLVAHSHLRGLPPGELRDREGVINGDMAEELVRRLGHLHSPDLAAAMARSGML